MNRLARSVPIIVVVLSGAWLGRRAVPPRDADAAMKIHEFGRLPVVYQGRVKPFDTLARNSLTVISDRQTYKDENGKKQPAIEWLLDVISNSHRADHHKVFRIPNIELQSALGLEPRKRYRYALSEFADKIPGLEQDVARAFGLEPSQLQVYDVQLREFWQKYRLHGILRGSHAAPHLSGDKEKFRQEISAAVQRLLALESMPIPHAIPPHGQNQEWRPFARAVLESIVLSQPDAAVDALAGMFRARAVGDVAAFNQNLADYQEFLTKHPLEENPALGFEAFFNHLSPFVACFALYLIAALLACFSWLGWSDVLGRSATWLIRLTFVVHTFALGARIYISGYPPVTNLYGTAIFIGWACVLLGLFIEYVFGLGIGNILASVVGALTLLIAHFLAGDGDTLQMMQAVLDTKFWLATHVIMITLGYSVTFFAGALAVLYILRGVLTRSLDKDLEKTLSRMIYGTLCFALLLSFVGTVLGGLWADDSWGRFWGWDPKENGALMIVLWNALIIHARWGGVAKARGVAVLAIFGNVVTAWSWFGVNQLGVGLHSYGFTDSTAFWLMTFVLSQFIMIGVGMLPRRMWRSALSIQAAAVRSKPKRTAGSTDPDLAGA